MQNIADAAAAYYGRTTSRILVKTGPGTISKDDEKSCLDESVGIVAAIFEIVDDDDDFNAGVLSIINQGDGDIIYLDDQGNPNTLAATDTLSFGYDNPDQTPNFQFDPDYLYAIYIDGTANANKSYLSADDAAVQMALFNLQFADDYVLSNGNGDVNIDKKNLVVSVTDATVRASITQLQVKDTTANSVKYNGIGELGSDILDINSALTPSNTNQVLVQSTDANLLIAVMAGNIDGVLYKTQNFLTDDPDNSLTAPITVTIYPAS